MRLAFIGWGIGHHSQIVALEEVVTIASLISLAFIQSAKLRLRNYKNLLFIAISMSTQWEIVFCHRRGGGSSIVEEYASLMRDMWSRQYKKVRPKNFKVSPTFVKTYVKVRLISLKLFEENNFNENLFLKI